MLRAKRESYFVAILQIQELARPSNTAALVSFNLPHVYLNPTPSEALPVVYNTSPVIEGLNAWCGALPVSAIMHYIGALADFVRLRVNGRGNM